MKIKLRLDKLVWCVISMTVLLTSVSGQEKILLYDTFHGQNASIGVPELNTILVNEFKSLFPINSSVKIETDSIQINDTSLKGKYGLILFVPSKTFQKSEKEAIVTYLQSGGSLLLFFDEEVRSSLTLVGINDIIMPFGMELTTDVRVRHNCGAIAEKNEICAGKRELPYSGGRSIKGGSVIARVYDEGNYIHSAFIKLPHGGKIIVMSDAMAGLLMERPDGERFHGTGPSDSKYWGKDSRLFMQEVFAFFLKD